MVTTEAIESTFASFNPEQYLREYYSSVGCENRAILKFLAEAYADVDDHPIMLEFGGGPTVYQLISAAARVREIHFSDYLQANLDEVQAWQRGDRGRLRWRPFIKQALAFETGQRRITEVQVIDREELVKKKVVAYYHGDAFLPDPINPDCRAYYDLVGMNFVAESITHSKETWRSLVGNVCSMVRRDGALVMTAIKDAAYYRVGDKLFPATPITEEDVFTVLNDNKFRNLSIRSVVAEQPKDPKGYKGYSGFIFVKAQR